MKITTKHLGLPACRGSKTRVYTPMSFLRRKIGKVDVDLSEALPRSTKAWKEMLKGFKKGDEVRVIFALERV